MIAIVVAGKVKVGIRLSEREYIRHFTDHNPVRESSAVSHSLREETALHHLKWGCQISTTALQTNSMAGNPFLHK